MAFPSSFSCHTLEETDPFRTATAWVSIYAIVNSGMKQMMVVNGPVSTALEP